LNPSNPIPVTAVFDIGKTNKKFFLFEENYAVVQKQQNTLDQTQDEDGDPCEDLALLEDWIEDKLQDAFRDDKFNIESINFSTYGASFVHLNDKGKPATPLYNYLKPHPEDLFDKFCETYGGKEQLSLQTASPPMGMLNSGFQLYWLKHKKPVAFADITTSLHLPQYLSYLIAGNKAAELTSIGCHTALWNFNQQQYHQWLKEEDLLRLLPSVDPVTSTFDTGYNGEQVRVGLGIHDSSAALAPYLFALDDPFMLISTGTWSITLNPFNKEPLTYQELQRDCLCYMNVYGDQVKASRLFLGNEYMHQKEKLTEHFGGEHWKSEPELDVDLMNELIKNAKPVRQLKLEQAYNSGPFPQKNSGNWRVDKFDSYKEGYHQLMLDLAAIQVESIILAGGSTAVENLIITGGFSQNEFFVKLLASFFPDKKIYTSSLPNASALGAAMVINDAEDSTDDKDSLKRLLGLKQHQPEKGLKLEDYSWKKSVVT
jgi:sugar (pentulose or hexulose) kinase